VTDFHAEAASAAKCATVVAECQAGHQLGC
jgi:hypothetical protein